MRFRQIVVAVVHVIVTAGQYIGQASETSTTREIAEVAEGTGTSAGANHGGTELTEFSYLEILESAHHFLYSRCIACNLRQLFH